MAKKCDICNKPGRKQPISDKLFVLCPEHNLLIEENINEIVKRAQLISTVANLDQKVKLNELIEACRNV
jgi:hypothetical protein